MKLYHSSSHQFISLNKIIMNTQEEQDIQFQIECLTNELVSMLMDERGLTME